MPLGLIWQTLLENPLINFLIVLSRVSLGSYGLGILIFTVISKVVTFPLTLKTLRSARAMTELSPALQEIQKKYSDPKRRSEETMKLYRENGVNPIGCLGPMLVQMPVFIALYATIRLTLGNTPENMLVLSSRLYDFEYIRHALPLSTDFLGMDLGENGTTPLGIVVFAAMWLQQRISTNRNAAAAGSQQAQMNSMMQWMFPIFFGYFFVVTLPAALGLYWGVSTIIGIVLQWVFVGPGDFTWRSLLPANFWGRAPSPRGATASAARPTRTPRADSTNGATESGEIDANEGGGGERQDGRRGRGTGARAAGTPPRAGRRRRHPRR
jgi:YidC/Oxa1 family membrane protein insertase